MTKKLWDERFQDIRAFERYLARNGVITCKFFLNVSKKEQKRRFLERLENPEKNWKFSANDAKERGFWREYMEAYEETIRNTATKQSPWYVVPADNKWFTRITVAAAIIDTLSSLDLHYPKVSDDKLKEFAVTKRALKREGACGGDLELHAGEVAEGLPAEVAGRGRRRRDHARRVRGPGLARLRRPRRPAAAGRPLRIPARRDRLRAPRELAP